MSLRSAPKVPPLEDRRPDTWKRWKSSLLNGAGSYKSEFKYISNFHASKLGKLSAFSKFWRRSHQTSVLWPNLADWFISQSQTHLVESVQRRNGHVLRWSFAFWLTFALFVLASIIAMERGLAKILRWSYPFSKLLQVTSIWIEAVPKCLVSSERERVKWTRKVLPSRAKLD